MMDRFPDFYLFRGGSSVSRFKTQIFLGDTDKLGLSTKSGLRPPGRGRKVISIDYRGGGEKGWSGISWQDKAPVPDGDRGYNLEGKKSLVLWARGEKGGEKVGLELGGAEAGTNGQKDSVQPAKSVGTVTLSRKWRPVEIALSGLNLNRVAAGLTVIVKDRQNPSGAKFYLADIKYVGLLNDRLAESYLMENSRNEALKNMAHVYDNSLAIIALLTRRDKDSRRRAEILGDSLIYAQNNDDTFKDGRLRDVYQASDLSGAGGKTIWRSPDTKTGNMAWIIIAWIRFYEKTGEKRYLEAAKRLGSWVADNTSDPNGGFTGGFRGRGSEPEKIPWKSTEHNIDLYVAFTLLNKATGDVKWQARADQAKDFFLSMWDSKERRFLTGTTDSDELNREEKPIDVNTWAMLAVADGRGLGWVEKKARLKNRGYSGFDFNVDRDGVWAEGTAFMALSYLARRRSGDRSKYKYYLEQLVKLQRSKYGDGKGVIAASKENLTTGAGFLYPKRPHLGATAWFIFTAKKYNPFS